MLNKTYWVILILVLISIIELLRRKHLREKYAIVWLTMGLALGTGAIFPNYVNRLSQVLGFQYLSNFVLFIFVIVNLLISMQLSLSIGKTESQVQTLAEEVALLKNSISKRPN